MNSSNALDSQYTNLVSHNLYTILEQNKHSSGQDTTSQATNKIGQKIIKNLNNQPQSAPFKAPKLSPQTAITVPDQLLMLPPAALSQSPSARSLSSYTSNGSEASLARSFSPVSFYSLSNNSPKHL